MAAIASMATPRTCLVADQITLRNSSHNIPTLMYGTAWKKDKTAELVYQAIKAGFRGIDTAAQPRHYQEHLVGDGIRRAISDGIVQREELFIQTKYTPPSGQDPSNMPYSANLPIADQIHASVKSSLHNLRADDTSAPYLDAVLLHSPLRSPIDTSIAWETLSSYVAAGKIRHVGIANCPLPILGDLSTLDPPPAIVQNRFYAETAYEIPLRRLCKDDGIVFQSFWTLTGNPQLLRLGVVRELAERVGVEREVALYAMVVGLGGISVLDGTTNEGRMKDDVEGLKIVEMWAGSEGKEEWGRLMKGFMEKIGEV